jgi:hypothetical protein
MTLPLHYITLRYITLHCIILHYITLHTYVHILNTTTVCAYIDVRMGFLGDFADLNNPSMVDFGLRNPCWAH